MQLSPLLAQRQQNLGPIRGLGSIGLNSGENPITIFARVLSTAIGAMTVAAILYFMYNVILGGIGIINAGGDKGKFEDARKKITNGVLGVIVVVSAVFFIDIISTLMGIPGVLNIGSLINLISP